MSQATPGTEFIQLGLRGGTASAIADLHSLMHDIGTARNCAGAYVAWMQPEAPSGEEADLTKMALWSTCCVSYRRVFASGKGHLDAQRPRLKLNKDWTNALSPEQLETHSAVLDMANQHIAHRVNDLEQVKVVAMLAPPPLPQSIAGVGALMIHLVGPEVVVAERLITVCDLLLANAEQENRRLSDLATQGLLQQGIGQLYEAAAKQQ
jgi:hypothetical protein